MSDEDQSTLEQLLGPVLLSKVGEGKKPNLRNFKESFSHHGPSKNTNDALKHKDFVLLYFSAAWCPPCQAFSPLLKEFYSNCNAKEHHEKIGAKIEVVYVSSDRDLDEFQEYYGKMPWLALESQRHKNLISKKCHVSGIPSLVVMTGEGKFVTDTARNDVAAAAKNVKKIAKLIETWKAIEAVPFEEATFTNSGGACAIL